MTNEEESSTILSLMEHMIDGRNHFLSEQNIRTIPFSYRPSMLARYMNNEALYIEFMNRIYLNSIQMRDAATTLITLTMPNMVGNFLDPVTVAPTSAQINRSLENTDSTTSSCAVCQDTISSGACRIRQCGHVYHRACIVAWFSTSVHCPVCRYDIRSVNPASQTSSGGGQMPSQSSDQ